MRHVFFGVLAVSLMGCAVSSERSDEGASANDEAAASAKSCRTHCKKCPPGRYCTMSCDLIGSCGSTCTTLAYCVEGYVWSEKACACVPSNGGGEACGDKRCPSGQVCCNASCGICTEPGGACIQMVCGETTPVQ